MHDGVMNIESEIGKETVVTVKLPAKRTMNEYA